MNKSDFKNYRALLREVQQLKNQIRILETSLYSPKGQQITGMPHASSGPKNSIEEAVARAGERHSELLTLYQENLAEKEARQYAIEKAIMSLPDSADTPERLVMRYRYIEGRSWPAVIRELQTLGYSERTVYRLHGSALLKLKEV